MPPDRRHSFENRRASESVGGRNFARAIRSHCRKAANRRIKHRLAPNPQPQEIRTVDRIAYIARCPPEVLLSRGAEERTFVILRLPLAGAPIQWLLRLTPSEPTAVEIDFRVSRIFRQPRLIVRDARGSGILFAGSRRLDTPTHRHNRRGSDTKMQRVRKGLRRKRENEGERERATREKKTPSGKKKERVKGPSIIILRHLISTDRSLAFQCISRHN